MKQRISGSGPAFISDKVKAIKRKWRIPESTLLLLSALGGSVLVSKKGKQTIKVKPHAVKKPAKILSHNRVKQYILPEGKPVPFLVDLGVMSPEGKVHVSAYASFFSSSLREILISPTAM